MGLNNMFGMGGMVKSFLPMIQPHLSKVGETVSQTLASVNTEDNERACYVVYTDDEGVCQVMTCRIAGDKVTGVISRKPMTELINDLISLVK